MIGGGAQQPLLYALAGPQSPPLEASPQACAGPPGMLPPRAAPPPPRRCELMQRRWLMVDRYSLRQRGHLCSLGVRSSSAGWRACVGGAAAG